MVRDSAGRIIGYTHTNAGTPVTALDQTFAYDNLNRLVSATQGATTIQYSYDATGNRTARAVGGTSYPNTIATTSNKLTQTQDSNGTATVVHDAAGTITSDGTNTYTVLLCALVVAILVYYMNAKGRITQGTYLAQRAVVSALGSDAARQRAVQAISTWTQELNPQSTAPTQSSLGVLTREFLSTYSEIVSPNGAHRLGLKNLGPSRYRPEMWAIGKSDYLDICVLPGVDTVYVIDGSETGDDLDDQYPSVFHLLVDYGEPTSSFI